MTFSGVKTDLTAFAELAQVIKVNTNLMYNNEMFKPLKIAIRGVILVNLVITSVNNKDSPSAVLQYACASVGKSHRIAKCG